MDALTHPTRDDLLTRLTDRLAQALTHDASAYDLTMAIGTMVSARIAGQFTADGCEAIRFRVNALLTYDPVLSGAIAEASEVLMALFDGTLLSTGAGPAGS